MSFSPRRRAILGDFKNAKIFQKFWHFWNGHFSAILEQGKKMENRGFRGWEVSRGFRGFCFSGLGISVSYRNVWIIVVSLRHYTLHHENPDAKPSRENLIPYTLYLQHFSQKTLYNLYLIPYTTKTQMQNPDPKNMQNHKKCFRVGVLHLSPTIIDSVRFGFKFQNRQNGTSPRPQSASFKNQGGIVLDPHTGGSLSPWRLDKMLCGLGAVSFCTFAKIPANSHRKSQNRRNIQI